jgi:hypothetical protein
MSVQLKVYDHRKKYYQKHFKTYNNYEYGKEKCILIRLFSKNGKIIVKLISLLYKHIICILDYKKIFSFK